MHELTEAVTSLIGGWGLYAVFLLSLADAILPAASELVMVYAGAVAVGALPGQRVTLFGEQVESTGWALTAMAAAGTAGYVLGSLLGWGIGVRGGRPLLERHGRMLHVTPQKLERAERWFERHGDLAVLVARVLPVIRSFISIPAGVARTPLRRYLLYTTLGSIPWYVGLAGAGAGLGTGWERFHELFRYADYAALAALPLLGAAALTLHLRRRRLRHTPVAGG